MIYALRLAPLLLVCAALPARATDLDPDTEIARRYFEQGSVFCEAQDYERALERFEAARRIKPLPAFDYNIGRCLDRLDRPALAIVAYERYLAGSPAPDDVADLRQRIEVLRTRLAPPPPAVGVRAEPAPRRRFLAPALVGGAALLLAGVATGLVASVAPELDALNRGWDVNPSPRAQEEARSLEARAISGYALWGVAGAVAVIDIVLFVVAARKKARL